MPLDPTEPLDCFEYTPRGLKPCARHLAEEQPLRIVVDGRPVVTLMRTPGQELELALGFLLTENIVRSPDEVGAVSFCPAGGDGERNEVRVTLAAGARERTGLPLHRRVFSSCGICGHEAIEEVARDVAPFRRPAGRLAARDVFRLEDAMLGAQKHFRRTGGSHAAALAEVPVGPESEVIVREDIGRHNALDKVVGAAAARRRLSPNMLFLLSGRATFEIVAKAARAGLSDVAAVSAPSELSVQLARKLNMFLAGFVRNGTMTVYSGREALRNSE